MTPNGNSSGRLVVDLEDEAVLDIRLAGAKAAWLCRARRAGLPVLPGRVVLGAASSAAIAAGRERLHSSGSGAARMAVASMAVAPELTEALTGRWERLAVRSSSPLEGSGEWSGAFASYLDVGDDDLAKTINGCWASSFTVSTLERFQAAGLEPAAMAVLVQPFLDAEAGGLATVSEGAVVVDSVAGSPAGLLSGQQIGKRTVVGRHEEPLIKEVGRVATRAAELTGATQIEWLAAEGKVWILQLAAPARRSPPEPALVMPADPELVRPELLRIARIVRRFADAIGETLVLPWALSLADPAALDGVEPLHGASLGEIHELSTAEANRVWRNSNAGQLAAATLAELAGDPLAVLPTISRLLPVDTDQAHRMIALIRGLHESDEPRQPRSRFEPLGAAITEAVGQRTRGVVASLGIGFGRGVVVLRPGAAKFGPRQVIVAPEPIPHLAPLLWNAAGLVTLAGSPAAHLFESARSLGVPAVAAADLDLGTLATGAWAVAVNGNAGTVSIDTW